MAWGEWCVLRVTRGSLVPALGCAWLWRIHRVLRAGCALCGREGVCVCVAPIWAGAPLRGTLEGQGPYSWGETGPQPAGQPSTRSSCLLYPPALPGTAAPAPARVDPFHQRWDWAPPKTAGGSPPRRLGFPGWRGEQLRASGWRGAEGDTELRRVSPRGGDGVGRADPGRGLQVEPDHLGHVAGDGQP